MSRGGYTQGKPRDEMLTAKILLALAGEPSAQQMLILGRAYVSVCRSVGGRDDLAVAAIRKMFDEARKSIITDTEE